MAKSKGRNTDLMRERIDRLFVGTAALEEYALSKLTQAGFSPAMQEKADRAIEGLTELYQAMAAAEQESRREEA